MNVEPLLTIKDVATRLNVPAGTVRKWTERGQLSSLKLGRHVRIEPAVLEAFIAQGRRGGVVNTVVPPCTTESVSNRQPKELSH